MKKQLLVAGALCALALANRAEAQITQNFNGGIPATWILNNVDGLTPATNVAFVNKAWVAQAVNQAGTDSCIVSTSWYNPAGTANDWIISPAFNVTSANMILTWEEVALDPQYPDGYEVRMSTGGTTPADFTTVLYSTSGANAAGWTLKGASLSAYNGQSIRIAFRNNSNDKFLLGIDDIATQVPANALDISVDSVVFSSIVSSTSSTSVKAYITNRGAQNVTSASLSYAVDGGTAVSQTFSSLNLAPLDQVVLTFTTPVANPAVGAHSLAVNAVQVNGSADPNAANNQKTVSFAAASQSVARGGLIEEFTSSTCVPCAGFNATFDPLILTNNANVPTSNFNIIKYQMNWPNPGNDVSYNNHGLARRSYYGVSGIPDHYTNGKPGGAGNQAEIDACKTAPAYMNITGSYTIKGDSLIATATITPYFTITGGNFRVHMAAAEKHYTNNGATTTQKEYYHVMRMMLPDGNGTSVSNWTSGTPQTFTYRVKYNVGSVAQGNLNFWGSPINSNLIVFVQDNSSKEVLQSKSVPATWPQSVNEISALSNVTVFPNPATDAAQLVMNLTEACSLQIQVTDALGRTVYQVAEKQYNAGTQQITLPTSGFASGLYNVSILSDKGTVTQRLSVVK